MPEKPQRASRLLAAAALLLVVGLGVLFEAMLAHELVKRYHRFVQAQPAQEMRLTIPGEGVCPRPRWDPHHGDPHHSRRERLTVSGTAAGCLPFAHWT